MESKTGKQRREVIDARNTIIDATNQFSDFCNMRLDSLQYRGIVQGIDSIFLSALTSEEIPERNKTDFPSLEFIKTSYGYEIKAYLVKVQK